MRYKIAENLVIDYEDFKEEGLRIVILARAGGGKSNLASLFIEQSLEQKLQVCVIEPIAEYYTLKSLYDDLVWVSEKGDVPLYDGSPSLYTDILARGGSLIITTGDLEDEFKEKRFAASFLESLYQKWKNIRRPILLVIEEAEGYAPQMWTKEDRPSLAAISKIAKRGRKLGINLLLVSQRPADLHKATWSQSNVIFIGGFKATRDIEAVKDMAKLMHLPIDPSKVTQFSPGEFFAIVKGNVFKIKAYRKKSPHGGETPQLQRIKPELGDFISDIKKQIQSLIRKKQEEEDRFKKLLKEKESLEKRIRELEDELRVLRAVKSIPIKVSVSGSGITDQQLLVKNKLPEAVLKCPHPGAVHLYVYLSGAGNWTSVRALANTTGLSVERVRKVVKYLASRGVLEIKWGKYLGKKYPKLVKLKKEGGLS